MHPLDPVEERLRCKFPPRFRATYAGAAVFTAIEAWEVSTPDALTRTSRRGREPGLPRIDAIAIGSDVGGNWLLLRFAPDGIALNETLWAWDHETEELSEVAPELAALFEEDEDAAPSDDGADLRERLWDEAKSPEDLDAAGVCKFCGSGLAKARVCSVCDRGVDEPLEQETVDAARSRTRVEAWIRGLVRDGRLELVSSRSLGIVVTSTVRAMAKAHGASKLEVARAVLERWVHAAEIAEVFLDEEDLAALLG